MRLSTLNCRYLESIPRPSAVFLTVLLLVFTVHDLTPQSTHAHYRQNALDFDLQNRSGYASHIDILLCCNVELRNKLGMAADNSLYHLLIEISKPISTATNQRLMKDNQTTIVRRVTEQEAPKYLPKLYLSL